MKKTKLFSSTGIILAVVACLSAAGCIRDKDTTIPTTAKDKYILSIGIDPPTLSVTPISDPATVTTEGVIANSVVELIAPAAPDGYEWVGWSHTGAVALVGGSDWTDQTINVYITAAGATVTAEYKVAVAICFAGEITVATPEGTLTWAGSNVKVAGEFADNPWDFGYYFTWDDALTACPTGWRLPTAHEINWLINREEDEISLGDGAADGAYTGPNIWTTGTGENTGFKIVSKYDTTIPEAQRTIWLPNAGVRSFDSAPTATNNAGTMGYYWSSDATDDYYLFTHSAFPGGYLNNNYGRTGGLSVRCVRN